MHHHHDVGTGLERLRVAGLLVGAVAVVLVVDEDLQPELARDLQRAVGRAVVDEDDEVHSLLGQLLVRHAQRAAGVVGRHDDDDLGTIAHACLASATNW